MKPRFTIVLILTWVSIVYSIIAAVAYHITLRDYRLYIDHNMGGLSLLKILFSSDWQATASNIVRPAQTLESNLHFWQVSLVVSTIASIILCISLRVMDDKDKIALVTYHLMQCATTVIMWVYVVIPFFSAIYKHFTTG